MHIQTDKIPGQLIAMCVLTLIGNLFLIVANLFKIGILEAGMREGGIGAEAYYWLSFILIANVISCFGSMLGAVFMWKGKLRGYTIYAVSMGVHALLVLCAIVLWAMTIYLVGISVFLALYLIVPIVFFLFFTKNRKHFS